MQASKSTVFIKGTLYKMRSICSKLELMSKIIDSSFHVQYSNFLNYHHDDMCYAPHVHPTPLPHLAVTYTIIRHSCRKTLRTKVFEASAAVRVAECFRDHSKLTSDGHFLGLRGCGVIKKTYRGILMTWRAPQVNCSVFGKEIK